MRCQIPRHVGSAARRGVAPYLDRLALHRYRTLTRRGDRARDASAVQQETIKAFRRLAEQGANTGSYPGGFERAVIEAMKGLGERDLSGSRPAPTFRQALVDQFQRLFYHSKKQTWDGSFFLGIKVWKNPLDLWIYQELLNDLRPDIIIETGTMWGGSAFYMAKICDMLDHGHIVTVDIREQPNRPEHPRITYVTGSSADPQVAAQVDAVIPQDGVVLVILDANHSKDHVHAELELWSSRVTVGSYVIVEDTIINGHPVAYGAGPGPMEAVDAFLETRTDFEIDPSKERFFVTFNRRGFLKRTA